VEVKTSAAKGTTRLGQSGTLKARDGAAEAGQPPKGDTATLTAPAPAEPSLKDLVAKAKAASATAAPAASAAPSLEIPGVPVGKDLPVTVKAAITVKGTAKVLEMTDDTATINLHVKGRALFVPIEKDVTVSLAKQADGTYKYTYKDNKSGETSEGVAKNIVMEGNTRRLDVRDKQNDADVPIQITDMGGGRFILKGEGFEADINRI
jgi:hypothetical protein